MQLWFFSHNVFGYKRQEKWGIHTHQDCKRIQNLYIHTALNDKTSKSSNDAETSVILILKSFEIQAFANPWHHQGLASKPHLNFCQY